MVHRSAPQHGAGGSQQLSEGLNAGAMPSVVKESIGFWGRQ